jgi:hypothetical protein
MRVSTQLRLHDGIGRAGSVGNSLLIARKFAPLPHAQPDETEGENRAEGCAALGRRHVVGGKWVHLFVARFRRQMITPKQQQTANSGAQVIGATKKAVLRKCCWPASQSTTSKVGPALFLVDDGFEGLHVHWIVADPGNLGGDACPVQESSTVTGKAGARSDPLRIVVCGVRIQFEKMTRILAARSRDLPAPFDPL